LQARQHVLQVVRRAEHGVSSANANVNRAVALLGIPTVRQVVLSTKVLEVFGDHDTGRDSAFDRRAFWKHCLAVACIAKFAQALELVAKPASEEIEAIDLNLALDGSLTMSGSAWRDVTELVTRFGPGLESVHCVPGALNQAVLSIVVNAVEAVTEHHAAHGRTGHIRIATAREGERAVIEIADNGPGLPELVQEHLFEPFFTTKGPGRGHGLASARAVIVETHRGSLSVERGNDGGTRVRIEIPIRADTPRNA